MFVALSNYISECNLVAFGKLCQNQIRPINIIKGQDLVNLVLWNKNGEIIDNLSKSKEKVLDLPEVKEDVVVFIHDMGESSCSLRMKNLIKDAYQKKPDTLVISVDYSSIVSILNESFPSFPLVFPECNLVFNVIQKTYMLNITIMILEGIRCWVFM